MSATAFDVRQEIVEESVHSVRALLDQAASLRRRGINVDSIIARLEHVLAGWQTPSPSRSPSCPGPARGVVFL